MIPFEIPQSTIPFQRYSDTHALAFAFRTGWLDDIGNFDPASGIVQSLTTPWWPDCQLITMQSPSWDDVMGAWILDGTTGRLIRLDGTSPPIHQLNSRHGTDLKEEHALAYLGFFCTFVHGNRGMFGLIGSVDETILPEDWPRKEQGKYLKAASIEKEDERGFFVDASVVFGDALFRTQFHVLRSGMTEMLDDELQAADLGTKIALRLKFETEEKEAESSAEDTPE